MVGYEYAGIAYEKQGEMLAARRRHYVELVLAGMGYAEAARAVGVSKRTGKVWRNGRTRSTGRNEAPCAEWTEQPCRSRSRRAPGAWAWTSAYSSPTGWCAA